MLITFTFHASDWKFYVKIYFHTAYVKTSWDTKESLGVFICARLNLCIEMIVLVIPELQY